MGQPDEWGQGRPPAGGFGAPVPPAATRPPEVPPLGPTRACRCGGRSPCVAVEVERARGVPVGKRFEHECLGCNRRFRVHSIGSVVFALFATTVLGSCGSLVVVHPPGSAVGAENENRWFGVAILVAAACSFALLVARIVARLRHPTV